MDRMMNMNPCEKQEPAITILENTDAILRELTNELVSIDAAIYPPKPFEEKTEVQDECMLGTLSRQRNTMEELLKLAVHIREGLW